LVTRGAEDQNVNQAELRRAELTLLDTLNKRPSPNVYHALGQVYLAKKQFDDAIKQFDEALKSENNNPVLYSDLGAVWLEKGKADRLGSEPGKSLEDFARSVGYLDRALELNVNLPEALFNRAIVHQYLMLTDKAEADWQQFLKIDSTSGWANDAREQLKKLQDQKNNRGETNDNLKSNFLAAFEERDTKRAWEIVSRSRDSASAGSFIRNQLLDEYLRLSDGDVEHSKKLLKSLEFLGQLESTETQDIYTSELAKFYARTSTSQRATLNSARELMSQAQSYHSHSKPLDALSLFEKAREMFARAGDSWEANLADLWIGYCHLNASNTKRSIQILNELALRFERQHYKWLQMRALHLLSGAEYNLSEYSRAIDHNRQSLAIAEQIDDTRGVFNTLSILIEQYRNIGNHEQSLYCIQRSLPLLDSFGLRTEQVAQYFSIVAAALSSAGLYRAAADYQEVALQMLQKTNQAQTTSRAYANLGDIYLKLGRYDYAIQQATQAYDTARTLSDERIKTGMMAYASQRMGDVYRQTGNVEKAVERYSECIGLYNSLNNYYGVYEAHKSLLLSYLTAKNDAAASDEINKTLSLIEQYRSQILEENNRNHFFDNEQSIYDLAIDFEYSRKNDFEKAFNYSEASRSRSLLDLSNSKGKIDNSAPNTNPDIRFDSTSRPLTLGEIREQMPVEAQIIQYAVLNDKLLIWYVSNTQVRAFEKRITQDELQDKVNQFVSFVSNGAEVQDSNAQVAKDLFEWLIKPVESLIDKSRVIYFVPDKALNWLPFNALISPDSNRFLIQDYLVGVAPSSTLFVNSSQLARAKTGATKDRVLSVGNPRFTGAEFPRLEDLPAAKKEAETIAQIYNSGPALTESRATKSRVEPEMKKASVIHFAAHTILNPQMPLRSRLVLAQQNPVSNEQEWQSNDLEAQDIYGMNLSQTKLVVLSSCESGLGKYYRGEGMMNLARPFLGANVPLVVVSLWPVDSESTAELMIRFHKNRRKSNMPTLEALRQAQLDLLSSPDAKLHRAYSWAAFTTVGGWATF
jgi:CHAT domain-containing protein